MISTQRSDVTFFGISKSISSVSGSAAKVNDIVSQINQKSIRSCVIGASSITGYSINHNIVHTALLLSEKKASPLERKGGTGILIEYGDYSQDTDEQEKNYVKNGYVIYRYEEQGGLRYYVHYFNEFKKNFCNIGYTCLDIDTANQISFSDFLVKIAPIPGNKWTKSNYSKFTLNCQDFTAQAIDILKPKFKFCYINLGHDAKEISKEKAIPSKVLKTLEKYEPKDDDDDE